MDPNFNSIILQTSPCLPCQREVAPQRRRDSCLLPIAFLQPPSRGRACPARTLPKASPPILNNNIPRQPPRPHQLPPARNLPRPKNSPRGCFCPAVRWTRGPGFSIPTRVTFYARHLLKSAYKEKSTTSNEVVLFGDPCGNRTHVNGVRGRCLNRLTNGP